MRSKNAVINLIAYFLFEGVSFAFNIVFPRFIILIYGSEVNGLTSTIYKLLAIVNLIQAGAIGAAIFQMFKPVAENDYETQSSIIYSSKKFYKIVTTIYFCSSCLLGIIYGFYLKNESLSFFEIFLSFITLGLSGSFTLFFNSICDIYVSPNQKAYYLKISAILNLIVHYGVLTIVLLLKLHFVFIYVAILLGSIVNAFLNYFFYRKLSIGKISNNPIDKNYVIPNRKFLMLSTIGTEIIAASPTIIITTFVNLTVSSVFSIYSMIFVSIKLILNSVQYSVSPIFGNAVNNSSNQRLYDVYNLIELFTIIMGTIVSVCTAFLIIPFIKIYTNGFTDANYLNQLLAFFVVIYIVVLSFRVAFNYVVGVYGLFKDLCKITLFFAFLSIVISILCVLLFDFSYVMIGLLFNEIGCSIVIICLLKKKISWFKIGHLIRRSIIMVCLTICSLIAYWSIKPNIISFIEWILYAICISLITLIFISIYCVIFERSEIKQIFKYIRGILKRKGNSDYE